MRPPLTAASGPPVAGSSTGVVGEPGSKRGQQNSAASKRQVINDNRQQQGQQPNTNRTRGTPAAPLRWSAAANVHPAASLQNKGNWTRYKQHQIARLDVGRSRAVRVQQAGVKTDHSRPRQIGPRSVDGGSVSDSQADSAGSIPVTRSTRETRCCSWRFTNSTAPQATCLGPFQDDVNDLTAISGQSVCKPMVTDSHVSTGLSDRGSRSPIIRRWRGWATTAEPLEAAPRRPE